MDLDLTDENSPIIHKWPARKGPLAKGFELFCKGILSFWCPLKVYGKKILPKHPFIICSNHASHMDSSVLTLGAGLKINDTGLIAARDYFFEKPEMALLHYMMNLIPIARGSGAKAIKETTESCQAFLKAGGKALVIYPEGTRAKTPEIQEFKQGPAILAHNLDVPIVPAYVHNTSKSFPKGSIFIKPTKVGVAFGPAIYVKDYIDQEEKNDRKALFAAYRRATDELRSRVIDLKREYFDANK